MTTKNIPSVLTNVLELLRQPHERGHAMAKARLALHINYNPQTVMHWCAGRRPIGEHALKAINALYNDIMRKELSPFADGGK